MRNYAHAPATEKQPAKKGLQSRIGSGQIARLTKRKTEKPDAKPV